MKLFMLKSLLLASIMFALALGGMQVANDGISRMRGYDDPGFEEAVSLNKTQNGELQVSIMGGELNKSTMEEKKKEIEKTQVFNLFSSMGKALANMISGAARGILDLLRN
ncbi:DUF3679 domain-containing protein [Neobacillus notoginsengisoli]|uniref:DUF3679 domain-containing protein n=1 Tax=Neobacillus notoginsengisoli TaxID=1578198 RepID=A0A417YUU6_9BACI|nr:DUF3679 domain-containing protein [Neobacillus notoginsengisoli]RHW40992.1 DUF3679 domain-containing protein [Neobacillus notoginsengisoli]